MPRLLLVATALVLQWALFAAELSARPRSWAADDVSVSARPDASARRLPSWMPFAMEDRKPNPAVARITAVEGNSRSQGSGTLVDVQGQRGLVVTNWHVIRGATGPIVATFPDGFRSAATVLKVDKDWDLAALLIWRPNAPPITISTTAPRLGDALTIAGYGSGNYQATLGLCTQYVAPGRDMPYEMVEVSARARQGDSGGPILNDQGELAGVLFGSGGGSTSGTFCGRVRWFLTSVWPADLPQSTDKLVSVPDRRPVNRWPEEALATIPHVATPRYSIAAPQSPNYNIGTTLSPATISVDDRAKSPTAVSMADIAGSSPVERVKTVLAIVGVLAVAIQAVRIANAKSAARET